jgi:imidazolonepropionase-like amidohydrolase
VFLLYSLSPGAVFHLNADEGSGIAIVGATLVDGTGSKPLRNSIIYIRGSKIVMAGQVSDVRLPDDVRVIDARGKWVVPGLIDGHVHFFQSGGLYTRPDIIDLTDQVPYQLEESWIQDRMLYTFTRYLCSGVTSVVDFGGPMWTFETRKTAQNEPRAPRIAVAGPLITTISVPEIVSDDPFYSRIQTPGEGRAVVRSLLRYKPEFIKIWFIRTPGDSLSRLTEIYKAVIEESHLHGIRVAAHATDLETAKASVRAGSDILAHSVGDRIVDDEFIHLMKSNNVIYVSTLTVYEGWSEVFTRDVRLTGIQKSCGDHKIIKTWNMMNRVPGSKRPSLALPKWYRNSGKHIMGKNLRKLQDAGVTIAAGSDAGNIGTLHGPALHRELELMALAGLSPMEILLNATRNAALLFSENPEKGTIETGKLADLLILEKNPLKNVRNLRRIYAVIKGGRIYFHHELASSNSP